MKRILIVQSDEEQSRNLSAAIEAQGDAAISLARTMREAFLLVSQEPYDLVLVGQEAEEGARRALHALQPDLALKSLSLSDLGAENGARLEELFRFLFDDEPRDASQSELPGPDETLVAAQDESMPVSPSTLSGGETLLDARPLMSVDETLPVSPNVETEGLDSSPPVDDRRRRLVRALEEAAGADRIVGGVLTSGDELLAAGGALAPEHVEAIIERVDRTSLERGSSLMQFIRLPQPEADFLLFTRWVAQAQQLTLAAAPDIDAGRLRRAAGALAEQLAALSGAQSPKMPQEPPPVSTHHAPPEAGATRSFALIFQPRRPLPAALQDAVDQALQDIAARAGFQLHHHNVTAGLVHVVTTCPGDRGSGWIAQRYKQGVEQRIQDQFGVQAHLWRKGFYATESDQPLGEVELNLFLQQGDQGSSRT